MNKLPEIVNPQKWELTKTSINGMCDDLIKAEPDPLRLAITIKAMGTFVETMKKRITENVKNRMNKLGVNKANIGNYSVTLGSRKSLSFDHCPYWRELNDKAEKIRKKHRDAMEAELAGTNVELKRIEDAMKMAKSYYKDIPTGKLIHPVKENPGTEYFSVSIPKK